MPECLNPGTANPDIAGLGIIIAFAVQGGISVALATALALMTPRSISVLRQLQDGTRLRWATPPLFELLLSPHVVRQIKNIKGAIRCGNYRGAIRLWNGLYWDILGLNSVPEFIRMLVIQGPGHGLSRDERVAYFQEMAEKPRASGAISADVEAMIETVNEILIAVSDAQLISGISLLVAAIAIHRSLTLYHFHIIYDMTNFTAVSFTAAYSNIFLRRRRGYIRRSCAGMLFCVFYLVFSALFGHALQSWDWEGPGKCYNTSLLATPLAPHPYVDHIYLGFTCFYMFSSCAATAYVLLFMTTGDLAEAEEWARTVLVTSFFQYPLHLYSVVALRVSNRGLLAGDSEDSWGFGQVVALVLLAAVLARCVC